MKKIKPIWFRSQLLTIVSLFAVLACTVFGRPAFADGAIANGDAQTDTISSDGEIDTWIFSANYGDTIHVQAGVSSSTNFSPLIQLLDPDDTVVASANGTDSAALTYPSVQGGVYKIKVLDSSIPPDGTATYNLYLAKSAGIFVIPADDEGSTLTNGGVHTGTIDLGDLDLWTFHADALDTVHARIGEVGTTGLKLHLSLYGPDGGLITGTSPPNATNSAQISHQAVVAGTYTVLVRDVTDSEASGSGDYQLYFANLPGSYSVSAGDEGGTLTNGGIHTGTIDLGDVDLWTFHADALDTIQAQASKTDTNSLQPHLLLYGPDGELVDEDGDPNSASISVQPLVGGIYTLIVQDNSNNASGSGDYSLAFSLAPDTTPVPAGVIISTLQNGGHVAGVFGTQGDIDKYSLNVNAGDKVRLQAGDPSGSVNVAPVLQVFANDGSLIAESDRATANKISRVKFRADVPETLTVVIFNSGSSSSGDYDLFTAITSQSIVTPLGDEGGILINGSVAGGSWFPRGDMDLYTLAVDAGDAVRIQLGEFNSQHANKNPKLEVFSSDGSLVAVSSDNLVARVAFTAEATDILTVLTLNDGSNTEADYQLYTSVVPQGFIIPTGDEGGVLIDGVTTSGVWTPRGDMDMYTYSNMAGSSVSITLECLTACGNAADPVLQVYADDGTLLGISTGGGTSNTYNVTLDYTAETTDTLYLLVFNNANGVTSTYDLTVTGIASLDSDGDGLSDALEALIGSDSSKDDTDGDGISDFDEVNYDGNAASYDPATDLNPLSADTDGDSVDDATELADGTDPLDPSDFLLPGDVNLDGLVNLGDYVKLIQFVLGIGASPSAEAIAAGDLNGNIILDTGDLVVYPRTFLGLI